MPIIEIVGRFAGPHVPLDHALIAVIVLIMPFLECVWFYPAHRRADAGGVPGARPRYYALMIATSWLMTAGAIALWGIQDRSWSALGLGLGAMPRLGVGLALAAVAVLQLWAQSRTVLAKPKLLEAAMRQVVAAVPILPRTRGERWGFRAISLTAGICEEVLYRGYVMWYVGVWLGPIPAVILSSITFGAAHLYLNRDHAVRASLFGLVMAALVLVTGSLWSAIIVHAASDLFSGEMSFHALSGGRHTTSGTYAAPSAPSITRAARSTVASSQGLPMS
jgi:CAAX protease family protein